MGFVIPNKMRPQWMDYRMEQFTCVIIHETKRFGEWTGNRDSRTFKNSTGLVGSFLTFFFIFIYSSMNGFHKSNRIWNFGHLH